MPDPVGNISGARTTDNQPKIDTSASVTGSPTKGPAMNSGTTPINYQDNADLERLKPLRKTFQPDVPTPVDHTTTLGSQAGPAPTRPVKEWNLSGASKIAGGTVKTASVLGGLGIMALGGTKVFAAMTAASLAVPPFAAAVGVVIGGYLLIKLGLLAGSAIGKAGAPADSKPSRSADA